MFNKRRLITALLALTVSASAQFAHADDSNVTTRSGLSYLSVSIIPSAEASDVLPAPEASNANSGPKKEGMFSAEQAELVRQLSRIIIVNGASVSLAGSIRFN